MNEIWLNRLQRKHLLNILPDSIYQKLCYKVCLHSTLNLKDPKSFNEKIQWLKLHDRNPEYVDLVDKYAAKQKVASVIGDQYIIPTLGVWDSFDEIDFTKLPNQFVLKCTHDSGGLYICRNKDELDINSAKAIITKSLKRNYYWLCREWPYKNVKPRIIAEKFMAQEDGTELIDYKFFCFNGIPQLLYISKGLSCHETAEMSFYDMNKTELPFHRTDYKPLHNAVIPSSFDEMKTLSEKMAQHIGNAFVRVDLYSINNRVYFSEITFSPCGGMIPFEPASADKELGEMLVLPNLKKGHLFP